MFHFVNILLYKNKYITFFIYNFATGILIVWHKNYIDSLCYFSNHIFHPTKLYDEFIK